MAVLTGQPEKDERRLRSVVHNSSEIVTIVAPDGTLRYANPAWQRVLGYDPEEEIGKMNVLDHVHPEDHPHVLEETEKALSEGDIATNEAEYRFRHKDGSWRWLESVGTYLLDEPAVGGVVVTSRDVTERKEAEEALKENETFVRQLLRSLPKGSVNVFDRDLRYLFAEGRGLEEVGMSLETLVGRTIQEAFGEEGLGLVEEHYRKAFSGEEVRFELPMGGLTYEINAAPLHTDEAGEVRTIIAVAQNVSERKILEERLEHRAFHDPLTDLPNRYLFLDRLGRALERTRRRRGHKTAVLFMDLDGFKFVNDSLGHVVGDLLLTAVAQRLRPCLRPEDTLARFGGDEFVVLIEALDDPAQAVQVAERITEELGRPFIMEGRELRLAASIGISLGDARTHDPDDLLREADTAMYRVKDESGVFKMFDPTMYERAYRRLEIENDLRRGIEQEEFVVHYQPVDRLDDEGAGWRIEALVRWDHPERGLLEHSEFVPTAEESALLVQIGEQVLEHACRQAVEWQRQFPCSTPLVMCVNLSARQLSRPDLAETVERVLRETGMDGGCLSLDVTETFYVSTLERHTAVLDRLKGMGVRISIDDFGMGYSSLAYLKRLPADSLKIDRSFVRGLGEDVEDTAIVHTIIELAHTLGLEVIAEGVESEGQATLLREMGCDYAQGYHFARPLPPEEIPALLSSDTST